MIGKPGKTTGADPDTDLSSHKRHRLQDHAVARLLPGSRVLAWIALVYSASLMLLTIFAVHLSALPEFPLGGPEDYTIFYTAAQTLRNGFGHRLYDLDLQSQVQQALLTPFGLAMQGGDLLPYNYPPFFALLFIPLSLIPLPQSFLAWTILNVALMLISGALLLRHFGHTAGRNLLLISLMSLSFFPVIMGLRNGQSTFVVLMLLTSIFLALKQEREVLAGALMALCLIKPQLVLPFVLALALLRRWRVLTAFLVTGLVLLVISWLLVGTDGLVSYVAMLRYSAAWDGIPGFYPELMPNVRGTVYRLAEYFNTEAVISVPSVTQLAVTVVISLAVFGALLLIWHGQWQLRSSRFDIQFAGSLLLVLLLSPHLYTHDLSLLVLAGLLVFVYYTTHRQPLQAVLLIALAHVLAWTTAVVVGPQGQAQVLTGLLLIGAVLFLLEARRASPEAEVDSLTV